MRFFVRSAVLVFSKSVFWERSQAPKLRGSVRKQVVHLYRSTRPYCRRAAQTFSRQTLIICRPKPRYSCEGVSRPNPKVTKLGTRRGGDNKDGTHDGTVEGTGCYMDGSLLVSTRHPAVNVCLGETPRFVGTPSLVLVVTTYYACFFMYSLD